MNNKILVGLRTTKFDTQTLSLVNHYRNHNIDLVLVVDELKHKIDVGGISKVSINKETLIEKKLWVEHEKLGWLCGDFGLYLMALAYPNYEGYWLIEDDACVINHSLNAYLSKPHLMNLDFCAKSLWTAHDKWPWKKAAEDYFQVNVAKKCSFGVVYISNRFVFYALNKRREYIKNYQNKNYPVFLNDESFLANLSIEFNYSRLDQVYSDEEFNNYKFSTENTLSIFPFNFSNLNNGFYHPIVIKNNSYDYIERLIYILKKQKRLGRVFKKQIISEIEENLKNVTHVFTPKVLVSIVYTGNLKKLEYLIGEFKSRWIDCIVINLTYENFHIDNVDIFQGDNFNNLLKSIEMKYSNFYGLWVVFDSIKIILDKSDSLAKKLEIPEKNDIKIGHFKIVPKTNLNLKNKNNLKTTNSPFYVNFDFLINEKFDIDNIFDNSIELSKFYDKEIFSK